MKWFFPGRAGGEIIQPFAGFSIVIKTLVQMISILFRREFWHQGLQRSLYVADQPEIDFGPPANLLWTTIDLDDRGVLREELLIWKICPKHQERVAIHHCVITRRKTEKTCHADIEGIIIFNVFLPSHRMDDWRAQLARSVD